MGSSTIKRDGAGRLLPGSANLNPGGRPKGFKGLAATILRESRNGDEFCEFAFRVLRNEEENYKHSDQVEMLKILLDRGFGKPTTTSVELEPDELPNLLDLDGITPEGLSDVQRALARALELS